MSLLRRIESARPAAEMPGMVPADPAAPQSPNSQPSRPATGLERLPVTSPAAPGAPGQGSTMTTGRMLAQVPLRESFRDAKFRIQQRVISDIDPKLDLANAVEVRREIEEAFGSRSQARPGQRGRGPARDRGGFRPRSRCRGPRP